MTFVKALQVDFFEGFIRQIRKPFSEVQKEVFRKLRKLEGFQEPRFGGHTAEIVVSNFAWGLFSTIPSIVFVLPSEGKSPEIHLAHPLKTRAIAEARM